MDIPYEKSGSGKGVKRDSGSASSDAAHPGLKEFAPKPSNSTKTVSDADTPKQDTQSREAQPVPSRRGRLPAVVVRNRCAR